MDLVRYEHAKRAVAEYRTVDEVKDFRDKAMAIEAYAKQAKDHQLEHDAAVARVRAERRCGELLAEMEMAKGGNPQQIAKSNRSQETTGSKPKTLAEMGLTKDQSSKFQKLAQVPDEEFERVVSKPPVDADGKPSKISTNKLLNPKLPTEPMPRMNPDALWLWGTLRDFREHGIFDADPAELIDEWTDSMKSDAEHLMHDLKKWVKKYE